MSSISRPQFKTLQNYTVAIALVLAALLLMLALDPVIELKNTFLTFYLALTLAALYGGRNVGLFATLLSAIVANYFFIEPRFSIFLTFGGGIRLLVFVFQGGVVSLLVGSLRMAQQQAQRSLGQQVQAEEDLRLTLAQQQRTERVLLEQTRLLELIATGQALEDCLQAICATVSYLSPQTRACFLLADTQGQSFPHVITPQFPDSFGEGLKDAPINELCIGTCGEAVYRGESISCTDIAQDDRWSQDWRDLCLAHGILACYSKPVMGMDGLPLGSLMLCFGAARQPTEWEYQIADFGTHVASIAFERERTNQSLHQNEERFRTLADNISQFAWMADAAGWIFWYNQRWFDYTGTTLEQMQGWGWQQVHHPDHVDRVAKHIRQCFEAGKDWEDTFPLRSKAGEYRWFLSRAIPIRDQTGHILRWFGTNTDITDFRQTEAELRQKSAILDVINKSVPILIFTKDRQGRITYANPATLDVLGKTAAEVIGARDCDLYPSLEAAARVMENDQRVMETEQTEVLEESTDDMRTFLSTKAPYRNETGEVIGLIGTASDISDRVQIERDRERIVQQEQAARQAAEEANRIKDEFLAVLSHELRSPLNPILGWTKLLQSQKFSQAETAQALETIERNAKLQAQLIEDLLDVSRILRGKMVLNLSPVNLVNTIEAAIETVRLAAETKGVHIHVNLERDSGYISGDTARLQQIIWNLLTNAVKFTPQGGKVEVRLRHGEGYAQIQVQDTGKGIKPDFLPYIFDSFRQEDGAITRKFGGLGLGLAIVRHLTEQHGGTITVESAGEGQGATFTVSLPLQSVAVDLPSEKYVPDQILNLGSLKILVVDDEADMRALMQVMLTSYRAQVQVVASAIEALPLLDTWQPDVLISDIGMPEMDGYMLLRQVRHLPPERGGQIPAIALTAYAGEYDQNQALAAGFQQHLPKPIEPEQLVKAIATLVKQQREIRA